jgi:hypothetical protein
MSNGGADKPGCNGGIDADRDGNNGCGNDTDREDDNNGWCGRKPKGEHGPAATPPPATTSTPSTPTSSTSTTTTTTTAPPQVTVAPLTAELTDCQVDANEASDCPASAQASTTGAHLSVAATSPAPTAGTDVAGTAAGQPGAVAGETTTSTTAPGTQVLGETVERPSSLPRTGAAVGGLTLLGLGLVGSGRIAVLARRLLRIG